jgi:hypothetical protein
MKEQHSQRHPCQVGSGVFRITKVVSHSVFRMQTLIIFKVQFTKDSHIFPHFTFDVQYLSKFDGETFVHFIDEPYTVQDFWDIQVFINAIC